MKPILYLPLALLAVPAPAQQRLFAGNSAGDLVEIVHYDTNPTLRWIPIDPGYWVDRLQDIAVRATTGTLFIHMFGLGTMLSVEIDPDTGQLLNAPGCFSGWICPSLDSDLRGHLVGEGNVWNAFMRLVESGPSPYCLVVEGPFTAANDGDVAFDRDGTLLCTRRSTTQLARVDTATGTATPAVDPGVALTGLEVDLDGTLFGLTHDGQVLRIDRATGATALIASLPVLHVGALGRWEGLAFRLPAGRLDSEVICSGHPNQTGRSATLWAQELVVPAPGQIDFHVEHMPPHGLALLLVSPTPASVVIGAGELCLGPGVQRVPAPALADAVGHARLHLDLGAVPGHGVVQSGDRLHFQAWFRDTTATGQATVNFSDALRIEFR